MSNSVPRPNGINHLALTTSDMKNVLKFFNEVLGMPLAALYWMHGVENTIHGFMSLNESSLLAFVYTPKIKDIPVKYGVTHSGNPGEPMVRGGLQHLAMNVDSTDDLLAVRDRIRAKGVHCFGPMDHGFVQSIYFAGPDNITLEIACLTGEDLHKWIDPEVVEMLEITPAELEELMNPGPFERPAEAVPNPSMDAANPDYRMLYDREIYEAMLNTPDDVFMEMTRDNIAPTESDDRQPKVNQ